MRERIQRQGLGKWRAFAVALYTVLRRYPLVAVRLIASDQRFIRRTPFVFIGNNEYETASFRMGGRKGLDGGRLSIYTAPVRGRFELFKLFVKAFFGRIGEQDNFDTLSATEVSVETRRRTIRVALDGEVRRLRTPLHYRVRPAVLRVIVPDYKEAGGE
jgi:diacylglycerol kinase family enzyme